MKIKRDGRSNVEKKFDEKLERHLDDVESLEDLTTAMELMKDRGELNKARRVSPDTVLVVVGNLLGIALILGYERGHIITTKALGLILRGRV